MKVRIAHLSDPHFGTVKTHVLDALTESIHQLKPDLIIISGDISQRARYKQFRDARSFTKSISDFPIIAIPGNHDIPLLNIFARLFYPYAGFRSVFKGVLERTVTVKGVQVLAMNSTSRFRHIQGDLNISNLKNRLSEMSADAKIRIITFHHPMDCPKHVDEKNLLKGREDVMKELDNFNIDLVLGGHIHDPYVTLSSDRYKEIKNPTIISVAGTCLSWRTRANAPNSFHLLDIEAETAPTITISRYDINKTRKFDVINATSFKKDRVLGWTR